ncbi:hypothetical protein GGI05_006159, partial [Coemansia sp. RSA 2603]
MTQPTRRLGSMTQRTRRVAVCPVLQSTRVYCALFILTRSAETAVLRYSDLPATPGSAIPLCDVVPIYVELTIQSMTQRQRIRVMPLYRCTEHT